jgi:uncharacterized cofD-like protein
MSRLRTSLKWLYPGMRVKRWIALAFLGLLVFLIGVGVIIQAHSPDSPTLAVRIADWVIRQTRAEIRPPTLGVILTVVGTLLCLMGLGKLIASLTSVLDPEMAPGGLVDVVYQRRKLSQGRRIVVIGGGTGLSTMLRGLKRYTSNITAIVTVADDGGSSGKLMKQLNILPPGDIRNCLVALADAEPQMMELFQFRFRNSLPAPQNEVTLPAPVAQRAAESAGANAVVAPASGTSGGNNYGEGLRDHAFGNLLIAAMCAINGGDFERAVQETSRVLNIRGRVLPSTVAHVRLRGEMEDGSILEGETTIAHSPLKIKRISLVPGDACPAEDVLEAIARADVIVLGPGSVFTSIIPNVLVRGIPEAIRRAKAKKVYVCNVMTQPGETDGFSAFDHIQAIERHAQQRLFDYALVNTGRPSQELLEKYRKTGSVLVEPDIDRIKRAGYRALTGNFISQTDVVRHDAGLLAEAIMKLLD